MRKATLTISLAALVAALIVIGCGGSGDSGTIKTSTLTKAEFLKKANGICHRGRQTFLPKLAAYARKHPPGAAGDGSQAEVFGAATKAVLLPGIESQIKKIWALGAPRGDEEQVEKFLDTLQEKIDAVRKLPSIASRFPVDRTLKPAGDLARAYGLDYCGYGEGPPS